MNDIREYIELITEIERQEYHKDMQVRFMQTKEFKAEMNLLKDSDKSLFIRTSNAVRELSSYYRWEINNLRCKFKQSGDSGKSKNYTQLDNNVYHYHIGGEGKRTKDGKEKSNNILEFQVVELPNERGDMFLVVIFFAISTHGRGRWNIDGIIELRNIKQLSDLNGKADRIKFL